MVAWRDENADIPQGKEERTQTAERGRGRKKGRKYGRRRTESGKKEDQICVLTAS